MKRRWIILTLTVLFLWAVVSRFTALEQLKNTLQQGQLGWVLAAFLSQIIYFIVFTASYQAAFDTVEIHTRTRDLIPVTLGALFVNLVVPAGIAGGTALSAHDLAIYEIVAAIILLLMTTALGIILMFGVWRPAWLQRIFEFLQRAANRLASGLRRPPFLKEEWAEKNADEFNQAAVAVSQRPSRLIRTIVIAFLAHLLDITTLYILFLAFHQPVGLGTLVAGYAMGILFWIVSITPQGIGVVEGVMALTFTSLGIPGAVATTVVLAFRGLTFWIPMLFGFLAVQRMQVFGPSQRDLTSTWGVRFTAIFVAIMGIVNVLSAVTPSLADRMRLLEQYSPLEVQRGGHLTAALAGFGLIALARSLDRRKRVAWILTEILLGLSILSHMIKGLDYEESILAGILMIILWRMRDEFHARSDPPSMQQGLRLLLGAFVFTLAYGVSGFFLLDRHYNVNFGFWAALRQTLVMFTEFYDPGLVPVTRFGRFFADSIYIVGAATFTYAGLMLLRPIFVRHPATEEERLQAKKIVEQYGHSSLARFLLFDDKHYFFTAGGSVIGYALSGRTAVSLGDPVGPEADLLPAIQAFSDLCEHNDWQPVFYQTLPNTLKQYETAGFDALCIGHEGIVNLDTFTLEGKAGKALRAPVNKLTKAGYKFILHEPPHHEDLLNELRTISDEWLAGMRGSEKRFSLGWFEDSYIRSSPIAAVHSSEGSISAFANIVTEYQASEVTIDLMRHRHPLENGTMEYLFVNQFLWARAKGCHSFNLGLSALSGVGEQADDPAIERMMHFIYENVNQFYNFKGLHAFKEKFNPEWSPRYLIYRGTSNLAPAWLAVTQANSGSSNLLSGYFKKR
jgi:phosphatidylglycerol lysyltransferase